MLHTHTESEKVFMSRLRGAMIYKGHYSTSYARILFEKVKKENGSLICMLLHDVVERMG